MAPTLEGSLKYIQTLMRAVAGVRLAPEYPPEDPHGQFPFVACYPASGTWSVGPAGAATGWHNIIVEVHVAREHLPDDVRRVMPFAERIPAALLHPDNVKLGDNATSVQNISYSFGSLQWGDIPTLGFKFTLSAVKIIQSF